MINIIYLYIINFRKHLNQPVQYVLISGVLYMYINLSIYLYTTIYIHICNIYIGFCSLQYICSVSNVVFHAKIHDWFYVLCYKYMRVELEHQLLSISMLQTATNFLASPPPEPENSCCQHKYILQIILFIYILNIHTRCH